MADRRSPFLAGLSLALAACAPAEPAERGAPSPASAGAAGPSRPLVLAGDVELQGFFRTERVLFDPTATVLVSGAEPWIPQPAAADAFAPGTTLHPEGWISPDALSALRAQAGEGDAEPVVALTPELRISDAGHMEVSWVGASDGKLAMCGSRRKRGVSVHQHAVESASEQPIEFVLGGLPEPHPASLTLEFADFVDDAVALRLVVHKPADGLILLERGADATLVLRPGRPVASGGDG